MKGGCEGWMENDERVREVHVPIAIIDPRCALYTRLHLDSTCLLRLGLPFVQELLWTIPEELVVEVQGAAP